MPIMPVKREANTATERRVRQRRDFAAMEERRMRAVDLFEQGVRPAEMSAAWGEGYFPYLYQNHPDANFDPTSTTNLSWDLP